MASLVRVADNGDENGALGNFTSRVTFDAKAGTTYHIKIDGYRGFAGNIKLNLQLVQR